ncbi:MAG TPA: sugar phosphate isomerase/epimerase family protein [Acidobacteriaceae bacterium]|nr:sugar phosphate isomerase/epimerase family protein [Acidobacteriaceae bacterium]
MLASRRDFLGGLAAAGAMAALPSTSSFASMIAPVSSSCPFRLSVINDEISQDFDHTCFVAAHDFGLHWIELRSMWNKNVTDLDASQLAESVRILKKYDLRVTDIASPLYKVDWPGAPRQKAQERDQFHAANDFAKQDALLEHCIGLTRTFSTDRIRCFDFWRLDDQTPYRAAINDKLRHAAETCAQHNIILLLENEMSCNTGTGEEAAAVLHAIPNRNFMLNWDPGNAGTFPNEVPYPTAYNLLPKDRIGHCHAKNVTRLPGDKYQWEPVGTGIVDWVGQLRALREDGYHYAVSLETHWRGAGTPEASSRISMADLKKALAESGATC